MLGFKYITESPIVLNPLPILPLYHNFPSNFPFQYKTHHRRISKIPSRLLFAQNSNKDTNNSNNRTKEDQDKQKGNSNGNDEMEKDRRPAFNLKWSDIFNPDPDNLVAVGLTGLLTWASVQVLWQLFVISLAILVAALKYSFIAAFLLFILITFL